MKIVVAPDSFKGSLTAREVADSIKEGILTKRPDCDIVTIPLSDGGDGLVDVLKHLNGAQLDTIDTIDSLQRPIKAQYLRLGECAIIEMATCVGVNLLSKEERNPLKTSSFGFGVMIRKALESGAKMLILGLGGSATNDGGMGALQALGAEVYDMENRLFEKPICGENLLDIQFVDTRNIILPQQIQVACDVNNPLYGPTGAAFTYARQKGADDAAITLLDRGLQHIAFACGLVDNPPKYGAAGGMGFALAHFAGAHLVNGIDLVMQLLDFYNVVRDADLIITGEGRIDNQSSMGKVVGGVIKCAKEIEQICSNKIDVIALGGKVEANELGCQCYQITPYGMSTEVAMTPNIAKENIKQFIINNL